MMAIPAVPAASSVTTIAFIRHLPVSSPRRCTMRPARPSRASSAWGGVRQHPASWFRTVNRCNETTAALTHSEQHGTPTFLPVFVHPNFLFRCPKPYPYEMRLRFPNRSTHELILFPSQIPKWRTLHARDYYPRK